MIYVGFLQYDMIRDSHLDLLEHIVATSIRYESSEVYNRTVWSLGFDEL